MSIRSFLRLPTLGWLCFAFVATAAAQTAVGPHADRRACALPPQPLSSARDTAAYCAAQFVARNGYTDVPPTTDSTQVVYELTDGGLDWHRVVQARANSLERYPFEVCEGKQGYSVMFRAPAPNDRRYAGVVTMTRRYRDLRLVHQLLEVSSARPAARSCTSISRH